MTEGSSATEKWVVQEGVKQLLELGPAEDIEEIRRDFSRFWKLFHDETERAAVILGAAQLDSLLRQALTKVMLPRVEKKEKWDELFGPDRPLGSFGARIHAGYRLGLIGREFRDSLMRVKDIRNAFAHNVFGVSFDEREQIKSLRKLVVMVGAWSDFTALRNSVRGKFGEIERDFRACVAYLCARLQILVGQCKGAREEALVPLIPGGVSITALEGKFHEAMLRVYELARDECGYRPTRYLQLVRRRGGVAAAKYLLGKSGPSAGLKALRDCGRLDISVEALVLKPEFESIFTGQERNAARERLREMK